MPAGLRPALRELYAAAMTRWLSPARYPGLALFLIMGGCAALFAWNSIDLAHLAMANLGFIRAYGVMALVDGGLLQLLEIIVRGIVSLAAYLGFKACEVELVHRWRSRGGKS